VTRVDSIQLNSKPVTPTPGRRLEPGEEIRIAAEIGATYCLARWWLARSSFHSAVAAARRVRAAPSQLDADDQTDAAVRLGRAVERMLRVLPVDSRCLVRALVLTRMLARRGIESSFVLGVTAHPAFAAHAWLERGGVPLLPTSTRFQRLTVL
jgi:Transglutaminase-like superfamily